MNKQSLWIALITLCLWMQAHPCSAGSATSSQPATQATATQNADATAVTCHTLQLDGRTLNYTATAGYLPIHDENGKVEANIFFVAYQKAGVPDRTQRPLTFAFNGGPGAASIWLHLSALGPKYVPFPQDGTAMPKRPKLIPNEFTWLDFTDLVFIDPVGTGYSRAAKGVDAKQYFDVDGDIESIGTFIQRYLTTYNRWLSPMVIAGESYGTTRAAGLAGHLQDNLGINPSGLVLISSVLDFQTIMLQPSNDLPYVLAVPSFAATAWYHQKLPARLQNDFDKTLAEVEAWSLKAYLPALAQGDALSETDRDTIADQLAEYTGLPKEYILKSDLRVSNQRFTKEFLRGDDLITGLMDSRVTGYQENKLGDYSAYDPAFFITIGPLTAAMNDYIRRELNYQSELPYEYLSRKANRAWDLGYKGRGYLNVAPTLQSAMTQNTHLNVLIAGGYYDLTTPYFSNRYMANHLGLAKPLRKHIQFRHYFSGHQLYTDPDTRQRLFEDAQTFYRGVVKN